MVVFYFSACRSDFPAVVPSGRQASYQWQSSSLECMLIYRSVQRADRRPLAQLLKLLCSVKHYHQRSTCIYNGINTDSAVYHSVHLQIIFIYLLTNLIRLKNRTRSCDCQFHGVVAKFRNKLRNVIKQQAHWTKGVYHDDSWPLE